MSTTAQRIGTCVIAVLMTAMLFHYWKIGALMFSGNTHSNGYWRTVALVFTYFCLNIVAIVGLFQLRTWRTFVACLAIAFSTIFFSTAYLFFINSFFAKPYRPLMMIIGNIVVFLMVLLFHKRGGRR